MTQALTALLLQWKLSWSDSRLLFYCQLPFNAKVSPSVSSFSLTFVVRKILILFSLQTFDWLVTTFASNLSTGKYGVIQQE